MTQLPNLWQRLRERVLLVDGAMGTLLRARGLPENQCREELNLLNPDLVRSVHRDYVRAGADILETNTFGANAVQLHRYGLERRVREINRRGVQLAREAASSGKGVLVAGSVGPLGALLHPYGQLTLRDVASIYEEQITALVEGGVDLLFIETQSSILEARVAIRVAKRVTSIPVFALMTFDQNGQTRLGNEIEEALQELAEAGADVVGLNCTIGPRDAYVLITERLRDFPHPLCVMPNAGYPAHVLDHTDYEAPPEYFAEYARKFIEAGVQIVGSCCGTTPDHTAAMAPVVHQTRPTRRTVLPPQRKRVRKESPPQMPTPTLPTPPLFPNRLRDLFGRVPFFTVEIEPPRGWNYAPVIESARRLWMTGADAVNVGDNPLARLRMSPIALATILKSEVGIEPIVHITCRDRNVLALQSELLGAAALGIRVVLALTGEPVTFGEYPRATSVFDVDAAGLIRIVQALNEGRTLAGSPIDVQTHLIVGGSANPLASEPERERERVLRKIENGAAFLVTQPMFTAEPILRLREWIGDRDVDIVVGIVPPISFAHAQFLNYEVPGVQIPSTLLEQLYGRDSESAESIALDYCYRLVTQLCDVAQGFYLMPPTGRYRPVETLLAAFRQSPTTPS